MTKDDLERAKKSHIPWIPYKDVSFEPDINSGFVSEAAEIANNAIIYHMYNEYSPD